MFTKVRIFTKLAARLTQKTIPLVRTFSEFKTFNAKDVLSNKEISVYKKLFDSMDSNRDGFLSKDDLKKGLKDYVNYSASEEELSDTMKTLGGDHDGAVGFDEFIGYIAWARQMRTEEAIRGAFEAYDKNEDGLINKEELRGALVSLGLVPHEALLNGIMRLSDRDGDGKITLDEFQNVFHKNKSE